LVLILAFLFHALFAPPEMRDARSEKEERGGGESFSVPCSNRLAQVKVVGSWETIFSTW
jgi:hypothetical protein